MGYLNEEYDVHSNNINFLSYANIYALSKKMPGNLNDRQKQLLADSMIAIYKEYNIISNNNVFENFTKHLKAFENKKNHSNAYGMTSIDSDSKKIFISLDESKFYDDKGNFMEDKYCRAMIHELLHAASARLEMDNKYNGLSCNGNTYLDEITTVYLEDKIFNKYFSDTFKTRETSTIYKVDDFFAMKTRNSFIGYDYINEYAKGLDLLEDENLATLYFSNMPGISILIDDFASNYKALNSSLDFSYRPTMNKKEAIMQTNYIFFGLVKDKIRTMNVEEYLVFSCKLKESMNLNFLEKEKRQSINVIDESIKNMDIYYFYNVAKKDDRYKRFIPSDIVNTSSINSDLQKMYSFNKDGETSLFLEKIDNLRKPQVSLINKADIKMVLKNMPMISKSSLIDINKIEINQKTKKADIQELILEEIKSQYLVFSEGITKKERSLKNGLELSSLTIDSRQSKFKEIFEKLKESEKNFRKRKNIFNFNYNNEDSLFIDIINNVNDYKVFEIILKETLKIAEDKKNTNWIRAMFNDKIEIGDLYLSPIEYCAKQSKYEFLDIIFEKTWNDIYIDKIKILDINNFIKAQYYYSENDRPWLNVVDMKSLDDDELKLLPFTIATYGKDINLIKRDLKFISEQVYSNVLNGKNEDGKQLLNILIERKFNAEDILNLYMDGSLKLNKEPRATFENLIKIVLNNNPDKLFEIEKKIDAKYIDYNTLMDDYIFDGNSKGIINLLSSNNVTCLSGENFYDGLLTLIEKKEYELIKNFTDGVALYEESHSNNYFYIVLIENFLKDENYEMLNYLVKEKNVSFDLIKECLVNSFNNQEGNEINLKSLYNIFEHTNESYSAKLSLMGISIVYENGKFTKEMFANNSPLELFGEDKEFAINCIKDLRDMYRGSRCVAPLGMEFSTALKVYEEMDFGLDK